MRPQEIRASEWIQCRQHLRITQNLNRAQQTQYREPDQHHRPEKRAHASRAKTFNRKERGDQDNGDIHNIGFQIRRDHVQSLDRAQYRDRRRNQTVAKKQRRTDSARYRRRPTSAVRLAQLAQNQRGQCKNAPLSVVIGTHDDQNVFERHHDQQRPSDQRKNTGDRWSQ